MAKHPVDIAPSEPRDAFSRAVERRLVWMRRIARLCSALGAALLLALALVGIGSSVVPRVMGMQPYAIISGSMEPAYPTGSLVYADPVDGAALQVGDVAAFWQGEEVIIHRVEAIDGDAGELVTKGDANEDVDLRPVPFQNVLGRVVFSMPLVGYFLMALGSTAGMLLLGWVVLMAVALCVVGTVVGHLAENREAGR